MCHDSLSRMKFPLCPWCFFLTHRQHSQAICGLVPSCVLSVCSWGWTGFPPLLWSTQADLGVVPSINETKIVILIIIAIQWKAEWMRQGFPLSSVWSFFPKWSIQWFTRVLFPFLHLFFPILQWLVLHTIETPMAALKAPCLAVYPPALVHGLRSAHSSANFTTPGTKRDRHTQQVG